VPSVNERVTQAHATSDQLATRVSALTIEYEQVVQGKGDSVEGGVLRPLRDIQTELRDLLAKSPWVTAAQKLRIQRLVGGVATAAQDGVAVTTFEQVTASASEALRTIA
jgi:hypothetical protein